MLRRCLKAHNQLLLASFLLLNTPMKGSSCMISPRIIDSHVHVWASADEAAAAFPYTPGNDPPTFLQNKASIHCLLEHMQRSGVQGALIVQPIHHKFDHSYVIQAIKQHPTIFKGMLLHDPSLSKDDAISRLDNLALQGFQAVRFNPYLWPTDVTMSSTEAGRAVYQRCAQLSMPVGIMCFHGLDLHYTDILNLIQYSPETTLILDHFGFTGFNAQGDTNFETLLSLAKYPSVHIKVSALFRLNDTFPFEKVKQERFLPLLQTFGKDRLLFGTDFPYVLNTTSYQNMIHLVSTWMKTEEIQNSVMCGTAENLFGHWGMSPT